MTQGSVAERIVSIVPQNSFVDACHIGASTLKNSLCIVRRNSFAGVNPDAAGAVLRNSTAISGGVGYYQGEDGSSAVNSAFEGAETDLGGNGRTGSISSSMWLTEANMGSVLVSKQVAARGTWVNAAAGDFRPTSASASVDAGTNTGVAIGELDLNGNLRTLGAATDIGAFEYVGSPPALTDPVVSNLTDSTVTIASNLNTQGAAARYQLELSPEAGTTRVRHQAASTSTQPISEPLTGLTKRTTYLYRLTAISDGGTTVKEGTFTTLPRPPTATVGGASAITATTATVGGTVDTDGAPATVRFEITPVGGTPFLTPEQSGVTDGMVTANLTGLAPNTAYQSKVRVETTGGVGESAAASFSTPPSAPVAVTGDVTNVTRTSARLAGVADTKGVQGSVSFLLDGQVVGESTRVSGPYEFVADALAPGSTHAYRLRVVTTGGTALGDERTFTTPIVDPAPTPSGTGFAVDFRVPGTSGKRKISLKRRFVPVLAGCRGLGCTVRATGVLRLNARRIALKAPAVRTLAADTKQRLRFVISKALGRRIARAFRGRAKVSITLRAAFTSTDGTRILRAKRVGVRPPKR